MALLVILAVLLALVCVASSLADWKQVPAIVDSMERLKVPMNLRPILPILKTLGAVGLLIGLKVKGLGAFAAIALVAYFIGAVYFHVSRAKDPIKEAVPAIGLTLLSVIVFIVRLGVD